MVAIWGDIVEKPSGTQNLFQRGVMFRILLCTTALFRFARLPKKLESTHLEKYRVLLSNKEKVKLILRQDEGLKEKKLFKWF